MEVGKLNVEYRSGTGKSSVRRLRTAGKIPAICYGGAADPITLAVDPVQLVKALDPVKKGNTVIELLIKGAPGGDQTLNVMVRDHQKDALRGDLSHVDFVRVQLDQDVHAVIPVVLTGKAEGVKAGGILHQVIRMLEIACTPDKIPINIEVDVSNLAMGDALHVSDLKLRPGVKPRADGGQTVCSVTAPKAEKVVEAVPVEGAVPTEGAAAATAAPAEGQKPGEAKPAAAGGAAKAAAPAKEGGEKKGK
jgi:large subunit ribosomal protein L25